MLTLSPRLTAVSEWVLSGTPMADIGTDHAYLPSYLVERGLVPSAIAADLLPGPLEAARATVTGAGLSDRIDLRLGNGLQVLHPGEVGTATICGMGGPLIAEILAVGPLGGIQRLVLQPMGGEDRLRGWLEQQGWCTMAERLMEDAGRIYVVMAAEPGAMRLNPLDRLVGPLIRQEGGELLRRYAERQLRQARRALEGARQSLLPEAQQKAADLADRIRLLEEVIRNANGDHR